MGAAGLTPGAEDSGVSGSGEHDDPFILSSSSSFSSPPPLLLPRPLLAARIRPLNVRGSLLNYWQTR